MKKATIEVPENMVNAIKDFISWEPAQMKKDLDNLLFYFAMENLRDLGIENAGIESAFTPEEFKMFLFQIKYIRDSLE